MYFMARILQHTSVTNLEQAVSRIQSLSCIISSEVGTEAWAIMQCGSSPDTGVQHG
jgi:hypothetical protein